ncbi:MAG: hypothetical protein WCH34_08850 [Bacteroidota bacterium]
MKKILFCITAILMLHHYVSATPVSGTFSIPGGVYLTISAAISDLNTNGVGSGGATFNVAPGYTESIVGLTLNTPSTIDSAHFILFQKATSGTNPKLTASGSIATTDAAIAILGTSYVTFDGIDIAVIGSNVEYGYYLQNVSGTIGAQNNCIKNCQITLNKTNNNSIGIYQNSSIAVTAAEGTNSNNTYHKITIDNSFIGIQLLSQTAAFPDFNCVIDSCRIGTSANSIGGTGTGATWGIRCDAISGMKVFGCEVGNITMTGTKNIGGIFLSNCAGMSQIYNNTVHDLKVTGVSTNSAPIGIRVDEPSGSTAWVYNNMVWGFSHGITTTTPIILCKAFAINSNGYTGTVNVYYNTAWMATGANPSNAVFSITSGLANVKNNIFYNTSTAGANSSRYCYYAAVGTLNASDYNELYISSGTNNFTGYYGANKTLLSDWRTATSMDANSLNTLLNFISASNMHLNVNTNCTFDGKGTPIAGISKDFDNETRSLTTPDIGADEFTSVCITPTVYTVTGGGSYCSSGTGLPVGLSGSQSGVTYQLYRNGTTAVGTPVAGTGAAISLGNQLTVGNYTVKTTTDGCYCVADMNGSAVVTMIPIPLSPSGSALQSFFNGAAVSDLTANGAAIKWYNASIGGNLLLSTDSLTDGNTYFASQTIDGCESLNRLAVQVVISYIKFVNLHLFLEALFDQNTHNSMLEAQEIDWANGITFSKFGTGIADRINVELFEENPPYNAIGVSIGGIDLTTGGWASFQMSPTHNGNYYIKVSNRNHLSVWSSIAVPFNTNIVNYDFTTNALQAYQAPGGITPQIMLANNLYALYLGDLDQSGGVDFDDFNVLEPLLTAGTYGFSIADLNGNALVDFDDFNLFEPMLNEGPFSQYPGMP